MVYLKDKFGLSPQVSVDLVFSSHRRCTNRTLAQLLMKHTCNTMLWGLCITSWLGCRNCTASFFCKDPPWSWNGNESQGTNRKHRKRFKAKHGNMVMHINFCQDVPTLMSVICFHLTYSQVYFLLFAYKQMSFSFFFQETYYSISLCV